MLFSFQILAFSLLCFAWLFRSMTAIRFATAPQFFAVPFRILALLCPTFPEPLLSMQSLRRAHLIYAVAYPNNAKPPPHVAYLRPSIACQSQAVAALFWATHSSADAVPICAGAILCSAKAIRFRSLLRQSISLQIRTLPCHGHAGLGCAVPSQRKAGLRCSIATPCRATPRRAGLCHCVTLQFLSIAMRCNAMPLPFLASPCPSRSLPNFATPCPCSAASFSCQ